MDNSKNDFENLELINKNSSCKCDSSFCENCASLEKNVHYLVKNVDKLSKGKSNFETVLTSQNCVFRKAGLGFNPHSKKNASVCMFLQERNILYFVVLSLVFGLSPCRSFDSLSRSICDDTLTLKSILRFRVLMFRIKVSLSFF